MLVIASIRQADYFTTRYSSQSKNVRTSGVAWLSLPHITTKPRHFAIASTIVDTMNSHAPWLLCLPHELHLLILSYNDRAGWKRARQTCRGLDKLAAPLLFSRVYFELCGRGCESPYNISQHPTLGPLVKTIVPRRVRGYRKFASIDDWAASTHQPGAPDDGLFSARETHYYDNQELSDSLMPYDDWVAMSAEQALYEAYNADREQQEEEVRDIVSTLCFRTTTTSTMKFIHPERALDMGTANVAVRQLNKALKTLPNLSALEHEPAFLHDEQWALRWRDLYSILIQSLEIRAVRKIRMSKRYSCRSSFSQLRVSEQKIAD